MSAGNLHPVELYLICGDLQGVPAGVYHFAPLKFGLTALRVGDHRPFLGAAVPGAETALAAVVLTGIPWRTAWKYGERSFRHLYWDAGTIVANLLSVAAAAGLGARVLSGFADADVARLVGVDGIEEFPLAVVALGHRAATALPAPVAPGQLDVAVAPTSAHPITFPLIVETQQDSNLEGAEDVARWRSAAATIGDSVAWPVSQPPAGTPGLEEVILQRGSTRLMRRAEARAELLGWAMAAAAQAIPADVPSPGRSLLSHYLSVHAVAGTPPGAYRWQPAGPVLQRAGELRSTAQWLCLDQPLGGDSAYTAFHCADLDTILAALGSRGYRVAQLEAGIAAGRLSLAAFALGYSATGLTFLDDPVSEFFDVADACMLVTAVGIPAYRNRRGGPPGAPAELHGYDRLMENLSVQLTRRR